MRILVTGDRNWRNSPRIRDVLRELVWEFQDDDGCYLDFTLIEGEAMGADIISRVIVALEIADGYEFGSDPRWVAIEDYPADWNTHHRAAGPIRNQQMLDSGVDFVVGFHNDIENSRGTKDMLQKCKRAGIPGRLFTETEEVTEWQQLV